MNSFSRQIVGDYEEIFVSHADWSNYKTMLKVIKRYTMPLNRSAVANSSLEKFSPSSTLSVIFL